MPNQFLSHLTAALGYTSLNAALYIKNGLDAMQGLIEILHGVISDTSQPLFENFLHDKTHITGLAIVFTGIVFLSISNQKNYGDMISELGAKTKAQAEPKETAAAGIGEWLYNKWFPELASILGTHYKVIVTSYALKQLFDKFMASKWSLGIAIAMVPFGEIAQFSVLGRQYGIGTGVNAVFSLLESIGLAGIVFATTHFLSPGSEVFATLLSWGCVLLLEGGIISANQKSFGNNLLTAVMNCCKQMQSEEKLEEEKKPLLGAPVSLWKNCFFWCRENGVTEVVMPTSGNGSLNNSPLTRV